MFAPECLEGQRRSGEEKVRRRPAESVPTSTAARPTIQHRGPSVPASATACILCPSTTKPTKPTQLTAVYSTYISAEPPELKLQHSSINPADRHGTGGALCAPVNWASPSPGPGSECCHYPGRDRGAWDWPAATAHWRRYVSKMIYNQIKYNYSRLYNIKMIWVWSWVHLDFFHKWIFMSVSYSQSHGRQTLWFLRPSWGPASSACNIIQHHYQSAPSAPGVVPTDTKWPNATAAVINGESCWKQVIGPVSWRKSDVFLLVQYVFHGAYV